MSSSIHGVPRLYDDVDDVGFDALNGSQQASMSYKGGTQLMVAASAPFPQGPAARLVASNTPGRVRIRVSPAASPRASSPPTMVEWAVAVSAGLAAAVLIGVVAAVI